MIIDNCDILLNLVVLLFVFFFFLLYGTVSRVTLGYPRATHTPTRKNPYPRSRVRVFAGRGRGFLRVNIPFPGSTILQM